MSADELRVSRARIAVSARDERRRIERALHDGVQQDLIAISVRLQLLQHAVTTDPASALPLVEELQRDTHAALHRIRALANEVYPSLLDARGLVDALRAAGARIDSHPLRRYPADLEAGVYFCCRTVMAGSSSPVSIRLREGDGSLRVELDCADGVDVSAARELVEAQEGTLGVESAPDGCARVAVTFPLA